MALYVTGNKSLPLSTDVQISVSSTTAQTRTNLTILCLVAETLGFLPDQRRVRFYSSLAGVGTDFDTTSAVYHGAQAFFAQSPRPQLMAVGEAYLTAQPGRLIAGTLSAADITAIAAITTGSMKLTVGGVATDVTGMNFTGVSTLAGIAGIIQARITAAAVSATCSVLSVPGTAGVLAITSTATGAGATQLYPIAAASGVFAGDALRFTHAHSGTICQGYTPTDIAGELDNIQSAANANGKFIYGWCLSSELRDVAIQRTAAAWALSQDKAYMTLVTNDLGAYDAGVTIDLASVVDPTNNKRVELIFDDDAAYFPDVSILAYMLSVNYQIQDSTVTAKFKQLPGIPTVALNETQWAVLEAKGYNVLSLTGTVPVFREGTSAAPASYMDTVINIDNFVEDLSVNVYNVFLMNKKVKGRGGQLQIVDACQNTGSQYVFNGAFDNRDVTDTSKKSGVSTIPAVQVIPTPLSQNTDANRAARIAPPILMIVQPSEIFHSVAINVQVVS